MTNEIKCIQFTAYDRHMRPEIDNDEYLEHELVETGLASQSMFLRVDRNKFN